MSLSSLHIIARAHNGFVEKFGIPRQSREGSVLLTRIVFEPDYRVREALRGIEAFSHLWLLWGFSANKGDQEEWSPTVRPPRLGGNTRMGVFATRSPYRPNPIGLTSVKLLRVEDTDDGLVLVVSGADLLDGTPIYDIKPYISFSDSHPDAQNGFAEAPKDYRLSVAWTAEASTLIPVESPLRLAFDEILSQDPRPAYQDDPEREYGLCYDGYEVCFSVKESRLIVKKAYVK
ncbi:MAG: tRNA (N6-threonylcarbamoyladenosine(37)-N6)-methyltransferase TrmO [Bacteroidales bacterium]|nr:tRNA (N6-threonylcarbamoyladenosine(37)-N6)-methyltransferase TrmO [Candidatus Colicola faecequi]